MARMTTKTDFNEERCLSGHPLVSPEPPLLSTVLGSWVAVCLWNPGTKTGAASRRLYPAPKIEEEATAGFGNISLRWPMHLALERDANQRAQGAARRLCQKSLMRAYRRGDVFGTRGSLTKHGIRIISVEAGGHAGHRIVYNRLTCKTVTGKDQNRRVDGHHVQGSRQH